MDLFKLKMYDNCNGKIIGGQRPGQGYSDRGNTSEVSSDDLPF